MHLSETPFTDSFVTILHRAFSMLPHSNSTASTAWFSEVLIVITSLSFAETCWLPGLEETELASMGISGMQCRCTAFDVATV